MNKTTVIVGGVIVLAVLGMFIYYVGSGNTEPDTATTTPSTVTDTTPTPAVTLIAPGATTNSAVVTSDTTASVTGTVVLKGALTTYWYEYGTTPNLGSKTTTLAIGYGNAAIPAPGYITGLTKNTTYYFRLVAENQYGKTAGAQYSFKTTQGNPPPTGSAPVVSTLAATNTTRNSVILNGRVNPNEASTQYWFEYGTTPSLGITTNLVSVGNGEATIPVSVAITNISPLTTFYFRINAQNQFGTVNGAIMSFKTIGPISASAPTVVTLSASIVKQATATLRGSVGPNGAETTYWFEYSKDSKFESAGTMSTTQIKSSTLSSIVNVDTDVLNLSANTTYYFRIVAQNSVGLTRGDGVSFVTKR